MKELTVSFVNSIEEIGRDNWNALSGTTNPFIRYEFLHALESTGCTTKETGWQPMHVCISEEPTKVQANKRLTAVMPLYLKNNSWGEYVFDWSWAEAYSKHGLGYYPKLVTSIPFTPSAGPRVCTGDGNQEADVIALIFENVKARAVKLGASSWHVLFPSEKEHHHFNELKIHSRIATQFHWYNKGYKNFDNFLDALNSRKRKAIRKERDQIKKQGITFRITEGKTISEEQWANFYLFYQTTYLKRGMQGYLELDFFLEVARTIPNHISLISALYDEKEIAAALFFKSDQQLFGRYWGSRFDQQFLHFETCYYQGQEYAIKEGLLSFDSGAQGEHKIQRGFEPIFTYSNHWIEDEKFSDAIADFLKQEAKHTGRYKADAETLLPFKKISD